MIKENIYKIKKTDKIMNKRGISFWDAIIWIGIGILLGWALLKSLGIIHSPIWVETLPYFGIGISAIGGAYKLGKIKQGIENTEQKIDKIVNIEERFKKLENEHKESYKKSLDKWIESSIKSSDSIHLSSDFL